MQLLTALYGPKFNNIGYEIFECEGCGALNFALHPSYINEPFGSQKSKIAKFIAESDLGYFSEEHADDCPEVERVSQVKKRILETIWNRNKESSNEK